MLNPETERRVDEMIAIAEEIGGIVPIHGWTKYAMKILKKLQDLSDGLRYMDTVRCDTREVPREKKTHAVNADDLRAMIERRRAELEARRENIS